MHVWLALVIIILAARSNQQLLKELQDVQVKPAASSQAILEFCEPPAAAVTTTPDELISAIDAQCLLAITTCLKFILVYPTGSLVSLCEAYVHANTPTRPVRHQ